jgi:hypothetical protein
VRAEVAEPEILDDELGPGAAQRRRLHDRTVNRK